MVCIYCSGSTTVVNSRSQRRSNHIWRRRRCTACASIFTSTEQPTLESTFMVGSGQNLRPFNRDILFLSIYDCCKHRPDAALDAGALTQIIIDELLRQQHTAAIAQNSIILTTHAVMDRFDPVAAMLYAAYHPLPPSHNDG